MFLGHGCCLCRRARPQRAAAGPRSCEWPLYSVTTCLLSATSVRTVWRPQAHGRLTLSDRASGVRGVASVKTAEGGSSHPGSGCRSRGGGGCGHPVWPCPWSRVCPLSLLLSIWSPVSGRGPRPVGCSARHLFRPSRGSCRGTGSSINPGALFAKKRWRGSG